MSRIIFCALLFAGACVPVLADVRIEGIRAELLANALAHLALDDEPCDAPPWRIRERFAAAPDEIRTSLEALGYYDAEVSSRLETGGSCWSARFDVEPGEPVMVRRVDFSMAGDARDDAAFEAVRPDAELQPGTILSHDAYEQFKLELLDLAAMRGYAEAGYKTSRLDIYPAERAADITLHFESGPRYRFGSIVLRQDVLTDRLARSYLEFGQGDFYDEGELNALYAALSGSGYFSGVDIRTLDPDPAKREIALRIDLQPGARFRRTYGLGYSTDAGPRFRMGRIDTRRNERGHQYSVDLQASPVVSELSLEYRLPYRDPRSEWLSFQTGIRHERTETSASNGVDIGLRRVLDRRGGWRHSQSVGYLMEDYKVGRRRGRSHLLVPGLAWTRLDASDTLRPASGERQSFSLRGASQSLGSDTSFLQAALSAKWIRSLPGAARILARVDLGATWKDELAALPPSVRFFAGGDTSVRGYDFESLGPLDAFGEVVGAPNLAVASVEYEHPVRPGWSAAVFVDAGDAFRATEFELHTGVGVGLRWQSPLGPIRIDVAKPLDGADGKPRLHISLGPDL